MRKQRLHAGCSLRQDQCQAARQARQVRRKCGPRDATIGSAGSASEGAAEKESFQARPKLRPGDIVEAVLGVVATQHSGDGKANQYFLRGFNLDPGTDFAVTVDWMPVNMPTHGHGQGFADLNFLFRTSFRALPRGPVFCGQRRLLAGRQRIAGL